MYDDTLKISSHQDALEIMEHAEPLTNFCDCGLEKPVTREWCKPSCPALRKYLREREGREAGKNSFDAFAAERFSWR